MGVLEQLEPEKVFAYFEEISKIPHGSGNVEQISGYLTAFARKRGLKVIQDAWKNVIIFQEATPGYEEEPAIILQGHMDMVAVKTPESRKDLQKEGLQIAVDGDHIYAEGTSLGGDDGIALAYGLAILDSPELRHPALELVFTVDEEVGMDGAREIDLSMLRGRRMINLDSEEEGIFLASCAGGARVRCTLPVKRQQPGESLPGYLECSLMTDGLLGGHSGEEIHKGRGNSNVLFGRVLWTLCGKIPVRLIRAEGGLADNAIPRKTEGSFLVRTEDRACAEQVLLKLSEQIKGELSGKDPEFRLQYSFAEADFVESGFSEAEQSGRRGALSAEDTRRAAAMLQAFPGGVQAMSADMEGLVETSLNLGILQMTGDEVCAEFSVRSSVESARDALIGKLTAVMELAGGSAEVSGVYPGWKYRADSPLREKMIRVYRELYGREPRVEAVHAGLECGLIAGKIGDLDCVSIGPDMQGIHTTEERLSISSVKRVWEFLVKLLETRENQSENPDFTA